MALVSAYALLGIAAPLVIARIEADVPPPSPGRRSKLLRIAGSIGAAAMTMGSVLLLVFVLPWLGLVVGLATAIVTIGAPYLIQRTKAIHHGNDQNDYQPASEMAEQSHDSGSGSALAQPVGAAIAAVAARPRVVLPIAIGLTALATVFAIRVPVEFDVEDFFAADTDFVVGLDQLDTHVGDRGGEPALIYVEGDMTDPVFLARFSARVDEIRALGTTSLARGEDGVAIDTGVLAVFDAAWDSDIMSNLVSQQSGVVLTDENGDGVPDDREQVVALLSVASQFGVPFDAQRLILTPDDVRTAVNFEGTAGATVLGLSLVDSRLQSSVATAKPTLTQLSMPSRKTLEAHLLR